MFDTMHITILDDGEIKIETDKVSGANHANAEQFFQLLARNAGGENVRERRGDAHAHTHKHNHVHGEVKENQ